MAKVFISYSRKDIDFAKRLTAELQKGELDFWIDWEGIPPTVDWWREIEKGIEESDTFLFLISPDSAKSKVCRQEIDHAVKNGKRLIPLVIRDTKGDEVHPKLSSLNWIFFRKEDDFDASITKLLTGIHTNFDWVETHRRLQVKALEWERNHKENSFLLRGKDLQDAEFQLVKNSSKEPYPTQLQSDYVFESRKNENMQKRLARRRRNIISIIGVILLIIVVLGVTGQLNRFIYHPVDMEDYWVTIPAGEFQMYDTLHPDKLNTLYLNEYQIGIHEITNRQYFQCVKAGTCRERSDFVKDKALHPVVNVTWEDAKTYCKWINGRLPTEAEWVKAATWNEETMTKTNYPWGDKVPNITLLNFNNYVGDTTPVGMYPDGRSHYGLFDMAGNVWEWMSDEETIDGVERRIERGGAWNTTSVYIFDGDRINKGFAFNNLGFRCARSFSP